MVTVAVDMVIIVVIMAGMVAMPVVLVDCGVGVILGHGLAVGGSIVVLFMSSVITVMMWGTHETPVFLWGWWVVGSGRGEGITGLFNGLRDGFPGCGSGHGDRGDTTLDQFYIN
ncbi:hypothetical protein [Corynebacterium gallinarum]|uniref:hypothetical protein n=1 Tax=Corynebacterium gallinarum TaxID=2762214 RepID=UPI00296EA0B6|nr:hypothetical protein [Corynebacterium gallinarum]